MASRLYCKCYINLYADDTSIEIDVILTDFEVVVSSLITSYISLQVFSLVNSSVSFLIITYLQKGLDAIHDWSNIINMLKLNTYGECSKISCKSVPATLYWSSSSEACGLCEISTLSWSPHTNNVISKVSTVKLLKPSFPNMTYSCM